MHAQLLAHIQHPSRHLSSSVRRPKGRHIRRKGKARRRKTTNPTIPTWENNAGTAWQSLPSPNRLCRFSRCFLPPSLTHSTHLIVADPTLIASTSTTLTISSGTDLMGMA